MSEWPTQLLQELRAIKKILLLANSEIIEGELSKIATTDERRRIWVLIDGERTVKDLAKEVKVTERAVHYFLSALRAAGFIEYTRGKPPRKILDYVPPSWLQLVSLPQEGGRS